jgi:hypothetical protein
MLKVCGPFFAALAVRATVMRLLAYRERHDTENFLSLVKDFKDRRYKLDSFPVSLSLRGLQKFAVSKREGG